MNNCIVCKGDLENRKTNFVADLGNCIIIVKDVPSQVCSQCGEVSYSHEVAMQLEKIVNRMKDSLTEVAIVHYSNTAAYISDITTAPVRPHRDG